MDNSIEKLHAVFLQNLKTLPAGVERGLMSEINWNARLIGIRGSRGIGKTTLMLHYIRKHLTPHLHQVLYVSLDSIWFSGLRLMDLAESFSRQGGKYLFLDEVHQYPDWAIELKNIYDSFPDLKVVFTGSSLLEILNARSDLSRRAVSYDMQGLSFREFLELKTGARIPRVTLEALVENPLEVYSQWPASVRPLAYFKEYLSFGYYPFFQEQEETYHQRIREVVNMILEIELPLMRGVEVRYVHRLRQLLRIISESVPFIPNVSALSEKIGIERTTLLTYFHYLDEAKLTLNLHKASGGISKLQKPQKVYLENPNLYFAISGEHPNIGSVREIFFANQVGGRHSLQYSDHGDFLVDDRYVMEIGGAHKKRRQIQGIPNAWVVSDDLEWSSQGKIPLWMFGLGY